MKNLWKASGQGTSLIQSPIDGVAETQCARIPKHHTVGVVATSKRNARKRLGVEILAFLRTRSFEITHRSEFEEEPIIGLPSIEEFERGCNVLCNPPGALGGAGMVTGSISKRRAALRAAQNQKRFGRLASKRSARAVMTTCFQLDSTKLFFDYWFGGDARKVIPLCRQRLATAPPRNLGSKSVCIIRGARPTSMKNC